MSQESINIANLSTPEIVLSEHQPEGLLPLMDYLKNNIIKKYKSLESEGKNIEILDPDWCRANPAEAAQSTNMEQP